MSRLILDPAILAHLLKIKEPVEICDSDGHVVGCFTPASSSEPGEWGRPTISDEELAARKKEGGRSLKAILADLEKQG